MKTRLLFPSLVAVLLFALPLRAERTEPALSPEQQLFAEAVQKFVDLFESTPAQQTVSTTLEVVKALGVPPEVAGTHLDLSFTPPDRIRLGMKIGKEDFECGRDGQRVWIWAPGKNFGVDGVPGMAKFATSPDSTDETELAPLTLPLSAETLGVLALICTVDRLPDVEIDGAKCRVLKATPLGGALKALKIVPISLTFSVRERDTLPVQIEYSDGKSTDLVVALRNLRVGDSLPETHWRIPATPHAKVERVALSHLVNFFSSAIATLRTELQPLGEATGEKRVLAVHGKGRLEDHDGTRVLLLAGTPEEMGEQHGQLLKRQVRDLVNRVLYGVGVGSSFEKGRWFFGEIEACQARIAKFIHPRYLREMDAMARASGCEREEIRLANFFPELFHCSGFALMGDATVGGRIYHGRVLDYLKGIGLEQNATVIVYQPDEGHAWVNIGYAGLAGTVTAMNEEQISIGEMGGRGEGNWDGKPMAQLLREVMENAATLDEAIAILQRGPRTCEYYYVIADGKSDRAVGIAATPERFEIVRPGEAHPLLPAPVKDTVLLSAGERYTELARRVQSSFGKFDAESARQLMTRPVCMTSNIHSVLFAPDTLDFWVANADSKNVASHCRYTHYNLRDLLASPNNSRVSRK